MPYNDLCTTAGRRWIAGRGGGVWGEGVGGGGGADVSPL